MSTISLFFFLREVNDLNKTIPSNIKEIYIEIIIEIIIPSVLKVGIKIKKQAILIILQIIDSYNNTFSLSNDIKAICRIDCKKYATKKNEYFLI